MQNKSLISSNIFSLVTSNQQWINRINHIYIAVIEKKNNFLLKGDSAFCVKDWKNLKILYHRK